MILSHTLLLAGADGWGPHAGGWFWPLIPLAWIGVIALVVWLVSRRRKGPSAEERARGVLADRYARGELSTDDYRERYDQLG